jgi:hypothetical protein
MLDITHSEPRVDKYQFVVSLDEKAVAYAARLTQRMALAAHQLAAPRLADAAIQVMYPHDCSMYK